MTDREKVSFDAKTFPDGTPWVVFEMYPHSMQGLQQGFLGFDLKPGSTPEQAQAVADFLNNHVENISFTPMAT